MQLTGRRHTIHWWARAHQVSMLDATFDCFTFYPSGCARRAAQVFIFLFNLPTLFGDIIPNISTKLNRNKSSCDFVCRPQRNGYNYRMKFVPDEKCWAAALLSIQNKHLCVYGVRGIRSQFSHNYHGKLTIAMFSILCAKWCSMLCLHAIFTYCSQVVIYFFFIASCHIFNGISTLFSFNLRQFPCNGVAAHSHLLSFKIMFLRWIIARIVYYSKWIRVKHYHDRIFSTITFHHKWFLAFSARTIIIHRNIVFFSTYTR